MKTVNENTISLIFCYARSGGTLLNKHLIKYDELVVLSEAHPIHHEKGGIHSIKEQLREWYGIKTKSNNYLEIILEAKKWCDENNKYLVIRDWSYIDFAKSYLNDNSPPNVSTNVKLLEEKFELNKIAFIRDGIDVYLSQGKPIKEFSNEYLRYVKYLKKIKIPMFRYEDFIDNSEFVISSIFKELKIDDIKGAVLTEVVNENVVGDVHFSRGNRSDKLVKLKRRYASFLKRRRILLNEKLKEANQIMKYSNSYYSKELEGLFEYLIYILNARSEFLIRIIKRCFSKYRI